MNGYKIVLLKAIFMLYKLLESERVCSGICNLDAEIVYNVVKSNLPEMLVVVEEMISFVERCDE